MRILKLGYYEYVNKIQPKTIIELGYGAGHTTVAMAYVVSKYNGVIHSYDLESPNPVLAKLQDRDLIKYCNLTQGDVYKTYVTDPIGFDLIFIDLHNTWELLFDLTVNNQFINSYLVQGAPIIIEGGAAAHPRINKSTLDKFHSSINKQVFEYELLAGKRTSISTLKLI